MVCAVARRVAAASVAGLLLSAGPAWAATIYGSLSQGGQALANARLELQCGGDTTSGQTDARGSYRFTVKLTGRCELRVAGGGVAPVIVYNEPTRYDYDLRRVDGRAVLVRR